MTDVASGPDTEAQAATVESPQGDELLFVDRNAYLQTVSDLRDEGFNVAIDVTSVDYAAAPRSRELPADVRPERFEVVVNLLSHSAKRRVRIRVQVPENEPVLPTLYGLYPGTDAMEREVYDLMGIRFEGHPDLTRILMPEDWEGHPLRKDYSQGRIPVQFKYPEGKYSAEDRP